MISTLLNIWKYLGRKNRIKFYTLLFLMLTTALMEMFTLGTAVPFLTVINKPEEIALIIEKYFNFYTVTDIKKLQIDITLLFIASLLANGILRMVLLKKTSSYCYSVGTELSGKIYEKTIMQSYESHINSNSSELISTILGKSGVIIDSLNSVMTILTSTVILLGLVMLIIAYQPKEAWICFFIIFII